MKNSYQVIIIGAGPAGIGIAMALQRCGVTDYLILEAKSPGAAFEAWPKSMRMLTPSFYANPFGITDLNAIDPDTSPADFLRTQHPTGKEYARYLRSLVEHHSIPVRQGVKAVSLSKTGSEFQIETHDGQFSASYVVWAAGQFFYPRVADFAGSEHCIHASKVSDWEQLHGQDFTIIGGYESGIDAAVNLCELGKNVRLVSRGEPWMTDSSDPSRSLSPRTFDRIRGILQRTQNTGTLELIRDTDIRRVEKGDGDDWWVLYDQDEVPIVSHSQPILANGFIGSLALLKDHFAWSNGYPVFSEEADESTVTAGLFYSGPELVHRKSMFCFIYKFRSRFGIIAREIAERLGIADADELLDLYGAAGFMNEDLECCTTCQCAIEPADDLSVKPQDVQRKAQMALAEI